MTTKSKTAIISKKDDKVVSIKERGNGKTKASVEDLRKMLDDQIENFQKKSQLIGHRDSFLKTKEEMTEFVAEQGSDYDEFMSDSGKKVVFKDDVNYRDGISINNNFLVREFAQFLIGKIEQKIAEIEKQILA